MCRSVEMVLEFIPRFCGLSALKFLLESSTIYVHTPSLLLLGVRVLKVLHWMRNDIISRDNSHLISCFVRLSWNFKYKSFAEIQVFFLTDAEYKLWPDYEALLIFSIIYFYIWNLDWSGLKIVILQSFCNHVLLNYIC
jgi:hypothetical protein